MQTRQNIGKSDRFLNSISRVQLLSSYPTDAILVEETETLFKAYVTILRNSYNPPIIRSGFNGIFYFSVKNFTIYEYCFS